MNDLTALTNKVVRATFLFLALCLLIWAFVPELQVYAAGLILGASVSLINVQLLAYRIKVITKHVIEKTGKRVGLGFLGRASMAIIAVMVSIRYPQFNMASVVVGLFFAQAAAYVIGFFNTRKL